MTNSPFRLESVDNTAHVVRVLVRNDIPLNLDDNDSWDALTAFARESASLSEGWILVEGPTVMPNGALEIVYML